MYTVEMVLATFEIDRQTIIVGEQEMSSKTERKTGRRAKAVAAAALEITSIGSAHRAQELSSNLAAVIHSRGLRQKKKCAKEFRVQNIIHTLRKSLGDRDRARDRELSLRINQI